MHIINNLHFVYKINIKKEKIEYNLTSEGLSWFFNEFFGL
jgi:hypothetical protein